MYYSSNKVHKKNSLIYNGFEIKIDSMPLIIEGLATEYSSLQWNVSGAWKVTW